MSLGRLWFIDLNLVSTNRQKKKKELSQYPAILTLHLANNPYITALRCGHPAQNKPTALEKVERLGKLETWIGGQGCRRKRQKMSEMDRYQSGQNSTQMIAISRNRTQTPHTVSWY